MRLTRVVAGGLALCLLGCSNEAGDEADESSLVGVSGALSDQDDEGTRLSAAIEQVEACSDGGAEATLRGEIITTGSVDSVELMVAVDGQPEQHVATVPPQAFVHAGRVKTAPFRTSLRLADGSHALDVCLVQSGARGRTEKQTCFPTISVSVACASAPPTASAPIDSTPPTTSITRSANPNEADWYRSDVEVLFEATDAESGVREIRVRVNGEEQAFAGGSALLKITAEGESEIQVFAVDFAGNTEAPQRLAVRLDRSDPVISFAAATPAPNARGWNRTMVTVPFQIHDALSGLAEGCASTSRLVFSGQGAGQIQHVVATDRAGNTARVPSVAVSIDYTPPTLTGIPSSCVLWSPNHKLVTVATIGGVDDLSGVLDGSLSILGTSNEPVNAKGDGNTTPDIVITEGVVQVRAERSGGGSGRVYTLDISASDSAGNRSAGTFQCTVPHDQRKSGSGK